MNFMMEKPTDIKIEDYKLKTCGRCKAKTCKHMISPGCKKIFFKNINEFILEKLRFHQRLLAAGHIISEEDPSFRYIKITYGWNFRTVPICIGGKQKYVFKG